MFDKILVPVDGSQYSLRAVAAADEIARRFDSRVTLLHVVHLPESVIAAAGMAGVAEPDPNVVGALEDAADEIMKAAAARLGLPAERVKQEVMHGHPAETICRTAEAGGYKLIVMGSRGLSEIGAFFLGGVSDKVSHHARCPVLIMR